ncbi:hypothetical protein CA54_01060 [Symmachiella macrocystis]|uniref:Outer membrane lipoprotein carrier protein LolA n=1 Tax=Symmachiella macrocystis TaxID=2527985 RepID=A0A5C6BID3_9PLAN|nr:hypothetical protein [Symmachiella macrocystis]TWU11301.1 hypothetical protein CA54_01060 [Symmachiella macrocystis]
MNTELTPNAEQDDLLNKATTALRKTSVPDGPPRDLVDAVVSMLENRPVTDAPILPASRNWTMIKRTSFAATAVLIIAFVLAFVSGNGKAIALADVIENVKKTQTLSFRAETSQPNPKDKGKPLVRVIERSIKGSRMRTTDSTGDIRINHMNKGIAITLQPAKNRATIILDNPQQKKQPIDEVVELLKKLRQENVNMLGKKEIDKQKAEGFLAHEIGPAGRKWEIEVWVDVKTGLPITIEQRMGKRRAMLDGFVWNEELDDSLFSLTAPEGYKVTTINKAAQ